MKLKSIEKMIPKKFIVTEYGEFEVWDLYETLTDGLEGSDIMCPVIFYNNGMEKWLLSLDIIYKGTRGSCYIKDEEKRAELVNAVRRIVYPEDYEEES